MPNLPENIILVFSLLPKCFSKSLLETSNKLGRNSERFTKIRTYGYLANRNRHQRINEVLKKMKAPLHHRGLVKQTLLS